MCVHNTRNPIFFLPLRIVHTQWQAGALLFYFYLGQKKYTVKLTSTLILVSVIFFAASCGVEQRPEGRTDEAHHTEENRVLINSLLDSFNIAAAHADYERYFDYFAEDAVFCGTDATENWNKEAFMKWAKPHFDAHKTWDFKSVQRHIYFSPEGNVAWFDELLNTQMKICRGSGVLVKEDDEWKLHQYILSATVPNPLMDTVIKLKAATEDSLLRSL